MMKMPMRILENGKKITVEVTFFGNMRKTFPKAGYRPHFVISSSDYYMGIVFTEFEDHIFDKPLLAEIITLYENIDYSSLKEGIYVEVREGANTVGKAKILKEI